MKILNKSNINFSFNLKIKNIILITLLLTSISITTLFTVPVQACRNVGTYEEDFETPKTTFMLGDIVYGKGGDDYERDFRLRLRDQNNNLMYISDPVKGAEIRWSWRINESDPPGQWHIQLGEYYDNDWHWVRTSYFNVLAPPEYNLTILVDGLGTVSKNPDQTTYPEGTVVQLTANPNSGYAFDYWSDDLDGNSNPETITMDGNKIVIAHFKKETTNGGDPNGGDPNGGGSRGGGISTGGKTTAINLPPVADPSADEPYEGFVNSEITFNGSLSYDPDGSIVSWDWDFGDGSTGEGEMTKHYYSTAGMYTVILTVIDDKGATNDSEISVLVIQPNRPPAKPKINGPTSGIKNIDYTYTVVSTDDDNDSIKYIIDWGDGDTDESEFLPNGTIYTITHTWKSAGSYTIKVTSDDNQTISSSELLIIIDAPIPEEENYILIYLALLAIILIILFAYLSKRKKDKNKNK